MASASQELKRRVDHLYRSSPGSVDQKAADGWLSAFVGSDDAWSAVLQVLSGNTSSSSPSPSSAGSSQGDEVLDFLAAKMLQRKVEKQWDRAPPAIRQGVEEVLCFHLRRLASGTSDKPILVTNQLVLAFVHFSLHHLSSRPSSESGFIEQLCQVLGIKKPLDIYGQRQALLVLLDILHWQPTELRRLDVEETEFLRLASSLKMEAPVAAMLVKCVLEIRAALDDATSSAAAKELKAAGLQCLLSWVSYDDDIPPLMGLPDLASCGLLPLLEQHADLETPGGDVTIASKTLQAMVESLRVPSRDGAVLVRVTDEATQQEAIMSAEAVLVMTRACLQACRQVLQLSSGQAEQEDGELQELTRVAAELVSVLIEHHCTVFASQQWYKEFREQRGIQATVLEELWTALLSFTGHRDLTGVASPTLEVWYYAPRFIGRLWTSPEALALLPRLLHPLLATLHQQCVASVALCGDDDAWASVLAGFYQPTRVHAELAKMGEGDKEEAIVELMAFRREANDTIQSIVTSWPEGLRARDYFMSAISQDPINPRTLEAALWGLSAVAAGQDAAEEQEDDDDEDEGSQGGGEGDGGGGSFTFSLASSLVGQGGSSSPRKDDAVWESVITAVPSLETWPAYVIISACRLLEELSYVVRRAPLSTVETVMGFLTRGLTRPHTFAAAARALKTITVRCCTTRQDFSPSAWGSGEDSPVHRFSQGLLSTMLSTDTSQFLTRSPEAYAHAVEATATLVIRAQPGLSSSSVDALSRVLLTAANSFAAAKPHVLDRCLGLARSVRAMITGASRGGDSRMVDAIVERSWPTIEQGVLQPATEAPRGSSSRSSSSTPAALVETACLTLLAVLTSAQALPRFLPVAVSWLTPFIQQTKQMADHQGSGGSQQRQLVASCMWSPPVKVLVKALARGVEEEEGAVDPGVWSQSQDLFDAVLDTADALLTKGTRAATAGQEWSYNPAYFVEVFALLRQMVMLTVQARRPVSKNGMDPWGVVRGVQLTSLSLEVPLQEPEVLRSLCVFLTAAIKSQDLPISPEAMVRLLRACLLALAGRVSASCLRPLADCLHLILHGQHKLSGMFQASLTFLTTSEQQQQHEGGLRLHLDGCVVDYAGRAFIQHSQRSDFVRVVQLFFDVCGGLRPVSDLDAHVPPGALL